MALSYLDINELFHQNNILQFVHSRPFLASWVCSHLPLLANVIFDYKMTSGTDNVYIARRHYLNTPYKEFHLSDPDWIEKIKQDLVEIYTNYPLPEHLRVNVNNLLTKYMSR